MLTLEEFMEHQKSMLKEFEGYWVSRAAKLDKHFPDTLFLSDWLEQFEFYSMEKGREQ